EPLRAGGVTLTIKLEQSHGGGHLIGRFRLSVTNAPQPADGEALPAAVAAALAVAPSERTPRQRADLAAYHLGKKLDAELAAPPPGLLRHQPLRPRRHFQAGAEPAPGPRPQARRHPRPGSPGPAGDPLVRAGPGIPLPPGPPRRRGRAPRGPGPLAHRPAQ